MENFKKTTGDAENLETNLSSVELTKTSKGVNIKVKVYGEMAEDAEQRAQDIFDRLQKKYNTDQ